ncbi:MAG: hypothetical protein ACOYEH_07115 [Caldicoprobacterales bacterium]|nr:hypothetical protein [Clostridiales bacterium]
MVKKIKGLTLIELVIFMALIGLVLQLVYTLFFMGNNSFVINTNKGVTQQEVRLLGDIIDSELKYITNMTTDYSVVEEHFLRSYYSLEFTNDSGVPALLRKFYEYNGGDYVISEKRYPVASTPYKAFNITNHEEGIINILIEHELTKGKLTTGYELPFNIHLLNNTGLATGVEVDLMDEGAILYYTKAQDMLLGKRIDIPDVPPGEEYEEAPEPTLSPEPTASPGPTESPEPTGSPEPTSSPEPTPMPVTKQVTAGGVKSINSNTPNIDEEGNLKIRKANQGDGRNFISIQLNNYIYDMHKNGKVMVTATVKNGYIQDSIILNEQSGIVSFYLKASANGSGKKVDVKLEVKTFMVDGEKTHAREYKFITN